LREILRWALIAPGRHIDGRLSRSSQRSEEVTLLMRRILSCAIVHHDISLSGHSRRSRLRGMAVLRAYKGWTVVIAHCARDARDIVCHGICRSGNDFYQFYSDIDIVASLFSPLLILDPKDPSSIPRSLVDKRESSCEFPTSFTRDTYWNSFSINCGSVKLISLMLLLLVVWLKTCNYSALPS